MSEKSTPVILIADDSHQNTIFLDRIVRRMGYETVHAASGMETIFQLEVHDCDIVLLDIMMPDMNGFEVLAWIRERYDLNQLPVILISALTHEESIIRGLEAGANDYITKPARLDIVRHRIKTQVSIKRGSDERQHLVSKLQKSNVLQQRMMRIASHDLKNPLNNMLLMMNLLQYQYQSDELVDRMTDEVMKMNQIIHEFLEMELMRGDQIHVQCEPMIYSHVVDAVVAQFEQVITDKGMTIQTDLSETLVLADTARMEQVLNNLVSNAIKYGIPGSNIHIYETELDGQLQLTVQNTGEPVPPEEIDELFKPFSRVSTTPTAGEHSSGLGLWIVQQMMEAQDGSAGINPDFRDGAEFWVRLPLSHHADEESVTITVASA